MSFQVGSRVTIINEDGTPVTSAKIIEENIGGSNVPMVKVQYDNGSTENIKSSRIIPYGGESFPNTTVPRRRLYGGKSRRLRRRSNRNRNRRSRRRT